MKLAPFLQALNGPVATVTAIVVALTAVVTAVFRVKTYFSRSRFLKPDAFPLPDVPSERAIFAEEFPEVNTLLVGRDRQVTQVSATVRGALLTFIYGESGSGKSTFLKLGLCRELAENWIPIYVDVWGTDWVGGPWKSLADATDYAVRALGIDGEEHSTITRESVFEQLGSLRSRTGRRPVLVFDQLDDYQNAHRARFRDAKTQFFLTPDELCSANPFWKEVSDLLRHPSEPAHAVLATREDAKDGLDCFAFAERRVYSLPRLDPLDASTLIQRLSTEAVVRNPENGFKELIERILAELGREAHGAILPMQLRVALAGLGRLSGPLTRGRLDKIGGVSALGAIYLEAVLRTSPQAWPILNGMAERAPNGKGKAQALSRQQVVALIPAGGQGGQLLEHLAATRILRQRMADSPDEVWQLYHDYLADAIVAHDRLKRRWWLFLDDAAERFRTAEGLRHRWSRLLNPQAQIRLLWQRLWDRDFRYGEHSGFARRSLIRLLVNPWTLSLVVGTGAWTVLQESADAQKVVDAFHQGEGHESEEFDALWRLAASRSDRVVRAVFVRFLATPVTASTFAEHFDAIQTVTGMRASALDAVKGLSLTGPCATPVGAYLEACSHIAELSGDHEQFADRIVDRLSTVGPHSAELGALIALAPQLKGDQAERLSSRLVELLDTAFGVEAAGLRRALAALASQVKGDLAEPIANRILQQLSLPLDNDERDFAHALAALAPNASGGYAELVANRIVEQLGTAYGAVAIQLARALAVMAPRLKGRQAERAADRIVERLGTEGASFLTPRLGIALAALAPHVRGNQAEHGASAIVEGLTVGRGTEDQVGEALAALAPHVKGNQAERGARVMVERLGINSASSLFADPTSRGVQALAAYVKGDRAELTANHLFEVLRVTRGAEVWISRALAALAPHVKGDQAARAVNLIVERLDKNDVVFQTGQMTAVAELATHLKGDQVELAANRIADQLAKSSERATAQRERTLAALATTLKGDSADRLANRIIELLSTSTVSGAPKLGSALAALAPRVTGDQADRLANRILERLAKASKNEADALGRTLALLATQMTPDALDRWLVKFIETRRPLPCGASAARVKEGDLLVDMLKWPVCTDRDLLMLRLAELQGTPPTEFGDFTDRDDRSTFKGDSRRFIAWLKVQRAPAGKPFDIEGSPRISPKLSGPS